MTAATRGTGTTASPVLSGSSGRGMVANLAGPAPLADQLDEPLPAGTALLALDPLKRLLATAPIALANRRIIAVSGNSGCGKTTAVKVLAARLRERVVFATLDRRDTDKQVIEKIYNALAGTDTAIGSRTRRAELMLHARHLIAKEPLVLVLDEAQNASLDALDLVRQLQEHPSANCGLIISGVDLYPKLAREPMVDNRVALRVTFENMTETALPGILAALSPELASYPPHTLLAANAEYCHGELRRWVQLVEWLHGLRIGAATTPAGRHKKLEQAVTIAASRPVVLP